MRGKIKLIVAIFGVLLIASSGFGFLLQSGADEKSPPAIRVACVGDSITLGSNYPNYLWMLLGSDYVVGNFGVGSAAVSLHSSKPYMNSSMFQKAMDFGPDVVILMLGTNDANSENQKYNASFVEDYMTLVDEFRGLSSKPSILIVKPSPVFNNGTGINSDFLATVVIPNLEDIVSEHNLQVIDVYHSLLSYPEYFSYDGVHPNEQGAQAIAKIVYNALIDGK